MTIQTPQTSLASLTYLPYLSAEGSVAEHLQGTIGVYGIFDEERQLQYVGYSRDIYLSLKQHLVRQPQHCYWLKVMAISRPSRKILEDIAQSWIAENQKVPPGNAEAQKHWTEPIDANPAMTEEEKAQYHQSEELQQLKIRKKVARRVQAQIIETLGERGVTMELRFNPKLKEKGLLDLK